MQQIIPIQSKWRRLAPWLVAGAALLASCGQPVVSPPSGANAVARSSSCYVTKIDPATAKATITFYGWPDNSPPGDKIAHPVIHKRAGGDGTYCNPTTFATEKRTTKQFRTASRSTCRSFQQYFIREDLCAASGPKKGSGSNGCKKLWFDLWIGATGRAKRAR